MFVGIAVAGMGVVRRFWVLNRARPENQPMVSCLIFSVALGYATWGAGFAWFVSLWPECKCPGKYDIVGHSHQYWHAIAVLGSWVYWRRMHILNGLNRAARVAARAV